MSRHTPQVAAWSGRDALFAQLLAAPGEEIGRSVQGRPIRAFAAGAGPCTLVIGAHHGDEPAGALAVARLAAALPEDSGRMVCVPVLNPDGFLAHNRDNARGVDLNRNLPTANFGAPLPPGWNPGPSGGSEPETQALLALLAREAPARVVSLHQPLACVNYDGPAAAWAEAVAAACGLPARADVGYPTPGSLGTYLGVERGVPLLTLELGGDDPEIEWPRADRALRAALASR